MAALDFSKFTFSAEEIRAVKELLWDEVIQAPEISLIHTIFENIVYDKEIGFIGKGGLVGVAQQTGDDDPVAQAYQVATRKVKWEPKGWEILIHQKRTDIEATAAVYSMKTGTSFNDFTSSDYMNIILEALAQSVKEFIIRLFWFNDVNVNVYGEEDVPTALATSQTTGEAISGTVYMGVTDVTAEAVKCALADSTVVYLASAAATGNAAAGKTYYSKDTVNKITLNNGGTLTPGTVIGYFNILNGFWKQMLTQITANTAQKVTVAENAAATYALQELVPANAKTYLQSLRYKAPLQVRKLKGAMIICTQSFYDAYELSLTGTAIESMMTNLTEGVKTLKIGGVPLMPIPIWDVIISEYYNNGTKLVNPHRAVYTSKELLAVGVDSSKAFGDMKVWYNDDQRKVKVESMGKADAKILNPALFQLAI